MSKREDTPAWSAAYIMLFALVTGLFAVGIGRVFIFWWEVLVRG